jgi:hypothetical protein
MFKKVKESQVTLKMKKKKGIFSLLGGEAAEPPSFGGL